MRIVQLSDIHLSDYNLSDLKNFYIKALIVDLLKFQNETPIDVILITGDLVDKGGSSLGAHPYKIFEDEFITPIITDLQLERSQVFFIPGNHDIDTNSIDEENEYFLANLLNKESANTKIKEQEASYTKANKRIEKFKTFEGAFHKNNNDYTFSLNESLAIKNCDGYQVGFALINDSWRCSPALKQEQHFIGYNQLFNAKNYFEKIGTGLNIAVFHHPLEMINPSESEEIDNILKSQKFEISFFGHNHRHKYDSIVSSNGGLVVINGRSAFNNAKEVESRYQPGYNILDVDLKQRVYTLHARKFIINGYRFDKDVESLKNGKTSGKLDAQPYYPLTSEKVQEDTSLPRGYSADVNRIVRLLIGKSLYPNQFIFARELIQNSVDACNRVKEKYPDLSPRIVVNINVEESSFEIIDEGDGMTKKVLKEHFAIIGKSISQEFNESTHHVNLISQFGIGFISTFIVARKVYVRTKSADDDLINFEIEDVFKGFSYNSSPSWEGFKPRNTGTSIKVYLKKGINPMILLNIAKQYCRHISNLEFYLNGHLQQFNHSWNLENGIFFFELKKLKYQCKLTISVNTKHLIATNSGFLINTYAPQIVPFMFPFIIGGEVVFEPRAIDFDLSRTNIMETEKSIEFKREISVALRKLFRETIESDNQQLKSAVLNYLSFYLTFFDQLDRQIMESYTDFYSKKELISLCLELTKFDFKYTEHSLADIFRILRETGENVIYFDEGNNNNDVFRVLVGYLYGKGFLIFNPQQITVQFRESPQTFSSLQYMRVLCKEYGFLLVDIKSVWVTKMEEMKIKQENVPAKITESINKIAQRNKSKIELVHFGADFKVAVQFNYVHYINFDSLVFQNIVQRIDQLSKEALEIYLFGLLGLDLSLVTDSTNSA